MSGNDQLELIWLRELHLAVIYPLRAAMGDFAAAAVIVKGDDGADLFIPYDGFLDGAPIAFSMQSGGFFSISVLAFGAAREAVELASWTLNEELVPHLVLSSDKPSALSVNLIGFGEVSSHSIGDGSSNSGSEIGVHSVDYKLEGEVDYNELLAAYLQDIRGLEEERFTGFFVTGVPSRPGAEKGGLLPIGASPDDSIEIGPAIHLRPLHHYRFGLFVEAAAISLDAEEQAAHSGDDASDHLPLEGAALKSRHGGYQVRDVPVLTVDAGSARCSVDFILRNGFQVHWRRQLENWGAEGQGAFQPFGGSQQTSESFSMEPLLERDCLLQQDGGHYFRWALEDAVIGDVFGLVFVSESAAIELDVDFGEGSDGALFNQSQALFIFLGSEFVPLTPEILQMTENQGVAARLQSHLDMGIKRYRAQNYLANERMKAASSLFERDDGLRSVFSPDILRAIAGRGPFGPELMVYRDHILRASMADDMKGWVHDIYNSTVAPRRGRLIDTLKFETFVKAPELAHALVFNKAFREQFASRQVDPHSFNMPVLEYLMSKHYSDGLIDWAVRLKGEAQAILWQLCLKRPHMVERLYELKLEPDIALNPFDETSLDHAEAALEDSSGIDAEVIEKKVMPVLAAMREEEEVASLAAFAHSLKYVSSGKALSLGELSVCLAATHKAEAQWSAWREDAAEIFGPLVEPLEIEVDDFETGRDFSKAEDLDKLRGQVNNLIERLVRDLEAGDEAMVAALDFIKRIESDIFLNELRQKLDLALKYHYDLSVGVTMLHEHYSMTPAQLDKLLGISASSWPSIDQFGPVFAEPFMRQQMASVGEFERLINDFAQKTHPNDLLFRETLVGAVSDLKAGLPYIVWLEAGKEIEVRRDDLHKRLKTALLQVTPKSARLRRSAGLSDAVRQMIAAERLGPGGWPQLKQSLDLIEKDLPV